MIEFYFATGNEHKVAEANAVLSPHKIKVKKLEGIEKLEIQHTNLEEIAKTALTLIVPNTDKLVLVEDSGLFVHELNGFPGPYSSYVFETLGVDGILKLLNDSKSRKAEFRSSVSFGTKGKIFATFSSVSEGTLTTQAKGDNGFGFDPIFVPMWASKTFGQMDLNEKIVYSHRSKALKKLALWYLNAAKTNTLEENAIVVSQAPQNK
ncbi:MAG: RdgB/HAM1 family non-canonical purine NTP pyrophosphatase [archaeon]|nr:RdgB/HAM1 family non-canonical purine NTP pyrophosphatase [archaeon]